MDVIIYPRANLSQFILVKGYCGRNIIHNTLKFILGNNLYVPILLVDEFVWNCT